MRLGFSAFVVSAAVVAVLVMAVMAGNRLSFFVVVVARALRRAGMRRPVVLNRRVAIFT